MNDSLWLSLETLPGGFVTDTPLAGGELQCWEKEAFEVYGVEDRLGLNRFYFSTSGRQILLRHLADGSYRLSHPEEAASMVAAKVEDYTITDILEPFMAEVRFYPETLKRGCQILPFGVVSRYSCQDALMALANYKLPLEIMRKRETLSTWRPFQAQMLRLLAQTTQDGWPFQDYPQGWNDQVEELTNEIEGRLKETIVCHFPQRTDSDFRRLLSALKTSVSNPNSLTGRDVAFCKKLLDDSQRQSEGAGISQLNLPGQQTLDFLGHLQAELARHPKKQGLDPLLPVLRDLPKALRKRVLRSRRGTLEQLHGWGILSSLEVLDHLAPQLLSGVFSGDHATLLSRCYRVFSARSRPSLFEELPWIKPIWSTPSTENMHSAVRQLLECWWGHFPQYRLPPKSSLQLTNLSRWLDLTTEKASPDLKSLVRATRPHINVTQSLQICQVYRERQRALLCPKPYQRQRRDKNLERCRNQERRLKLLFASKSP